MISQLVTIRPVSFNEFREHTHLGSLQIFPFFWLPQWIGMVDFVGGLYLPHIPHTLLLPFPLNLILASFEVRIFWRSASKPLPATPHPNLSIEV